MKLCYVSPVDQQVAAAAQWILLHSASERLHITFTHDSCLSLHRPHSQEVHQCFMITRTNDNPDESAGDEVEDTLHQLISFSGKHTERSFLTRRSNSD